ncbi:AAA family ATPase [Agrobacterium rosae]|uniref:AAA family ATPase n=1 Tax=Agrobacterium rosae TaxID=1972867 RepID=UPI002A0E2300|nr:AAA family ATPase [Agrobacterium rosae]MDX8315177.1 AAA family ATPase [Agrobacterium rosae]
MRLRSVTIEGFRGFSRKVTIDLDADVIILQGPNGVGKTSLLDAVLWALTGKIERFGDRGSPISLYAREGIARVSLDIGTDNQKVTIARSSDGERDSLRLNVGDQMVEGAPAEARLSEILLPQLRERTQSARAMASVLTRGVYLQQDLVRQFIDTDKPSDRFQLISEVIGAGVVLELQGTLEKSRLQWAKSTTAIRKERLEPLEIQAARLDDQLARLETTSSSEGFDARATAKDLYDDIVRTVGRSRISLDVPPVTSGELDRLLKEIASERSSLEREYATVRSLLEENLRLRNSEREEVTLIVSLENQEKEKLDSLRQCEEQLNAIIEEQNRLQQRRLAEKDRLARLATMAQMAITELAGPCPVCQQSHDQESTLLHLQDLIKNAAAYRSDDDGAGDLNEVNVRRNMLTAELEELRSKLRSVRARQQDAETRQSLFETRLMDLGMADDEQVAETLSIRATVLEQQIQTVALAQARGEDLTLQIVRVGEERRRSELDKEKTELHARIKSLNGEIARLEKTHALAGSIIDALRRASLEVTRQQIEGLQPLFQRIYSRIDPHPTFRLTQITAAMERGKGLLNAGVSDPDQGATIHDALPLLSSSQLNAFAVSLFLALNLGLPSLKLDLTMLDDPLQSLDAINLLGLVDVLRRFRQHRQIIVSTHEPKLLGLLQRKMRPVREGERMLTMFFDSWTTDGPVYRSVSAGYEPDTLRVLAA